MKITIFSNNLNLKSAKMCVLFLLLACMCIAQVQNKRILALYHVPSPSHQMLGEIVVKGLTEKGHHVTMVTPFPLRNTIPNCKHLLITEMMERMQKFKLIFRRTRNERLLHEFLQFGSILHEITEQTLNSSAIQSLIKSNTTKFDLIIMDEFFNKAHYGLGYRFNAPIIVSSSSNSFIVNHITGNPAPFSFVPNMITAFSDRMSFFERVQNTLFGLLTFAMLHFLVFPNQEIIYRKYFPNSPELHELISNVSLVLVNMHPVLESPRPYMPNMIPIGGFHVQDPKKLSQELQNFLDSANKGVIYCSLGSSLQSSELSDEKIQVLLKVFSKLSQKVLWKWESRNLPNLPSNIKVQEWFPQRDILAHPNVKVFITQGGILSTTESIVSGVPLIGIPFFGDQISNVGNMVSGGYGLRILYEDLNEETLTNALEEILQTPKYRLEAEFRSRIIRDQPLKPLDLAIYWMEFIMRHKSGKHLHSAAAEINMYQYLLLDVVVFLLALFTTVLIGLYCLVIKLWCVKRKITHENKTKKRKTQ